MYHVDISRHFFVCQLKIRFYFLHESKQRSSDVTGQHWRPIDSDVNEGVKHVKGILWNSGYKSFDFLSFVFSLLSHLLYCFSVPIPQLYSNESHPSKKKATGNIFIDPKLPEKKLHHKIWQVSSLLNSLFPAHCLLEFLPCLCSHEVRTQIFWEHSL